MVKPDPYCINEDGKRPNAIVIHMRSDRNNLRLGPLLSDPLNYLFRGRVFYVKAYLTVAADGEISKPTVA